MAKQAREEMTIGDARRALADAQDAQDLAIQAAEKARVDVEIAQEDLRAARVRASVADAESRGDEAGAIAAGFLGRLEQFLDSQPDVSDLDQVSDGIFGLRIAGVGDVSLMINRTGESHFTG